MIPQPQEGDTRERIKSVLRWLAPEADARLIGEATTRISIVTKPSPAVPGALDLEAAKAKVMDILFGLGFCIAIGPKEEIGKNIEEAADSILALSRPSPEKAPAEGVREMIIEVPKDKRKNPILSLLGESEGISALPPGEYRFREVVEAPVGEGQP